MNKKIKIGQLGIGHNHGAAKMEAVRKFPELFEVVGYAEEDEGWVKSRGGFDAYKGLERLGTEEIIEKSDALLVETDVWNLTKYAKLCTEAGKHLHMDKPASGTLEEWADVLKQAKSKNLVLQMGYMYRCNPAIQKCIELAKSGALGEIYSIDAQMSTFHTKEYRQWLTNFEGGIMHILGSHLIDIVVYILGEPNCTHSFLKSTGLDGIHFADNDLAIMEYDKALARIYVSSVEHNGYGRRQLTISGSKGSVSVLPIEGDEYVESTVTYSDAAIATDPYKCLSEKLDVPILDKKNRYDDVVRDFYAYIIGEKENPYSYEHEYQLQKVLYDIAKGKIL